ncbi:BglG family transcription antiterminator [Alkalicoccus saliphilus]|uniref:PTS sugar transporter n=1 Tax=Alkalicoccus saliphilus TaxID=200989 RepID=A0A2T4U988_9BACI|nr:BglG family transcription antiterminator [Alkalicoccus saliphilus]PTL39955.1 PTS sugar transporter [Alkalicoccus saliphilus]
MYVSARDRRILDELLAYPEGVTIGHLAEVLDVSERTIHRDLASFDNLLHPYELFLEKKAGRGLRLTGSKTRLQQFREDLEQAKHFDFLPEQRQLLLTHKLLTATEPVKLQALASDLHVTNATVSTDLDKAAEWLESYQLSLLRRRGSGIQIAGDEAAKRRAIRGLLSDHLGETELLRFIRRHTVPGGTPRTQSISDQLLGFVQTERLEQIETAVEKLNHTLTRPIADSSYIALVVHLALAMERIQQGENVQMKEELLDRLRPTPEYKKAAELARQLARIFQADIPEAEIGYITMHLRGAKLQSEELLQTADHMDAVLLVKRLVRHVSLNYGIDFSSNPSLEQGLTAHISPALYRLEQQMKIHNPLASAVKENFPDLFAAVQEAAGHIFEDLDVPEDEIGFLVMHFGSALETGNEHKTFRAFVICSSGIGSSKMMSTRLRKEFPQIKEIHQLSLFELTETAPAADDLVLSTIALDNPGLDYIQVNPFLTAEDTKKIEHYIGLKTAASVHVSRPSSGNHPEKTTLESLQSQLETTIRLMQHVTIVQETTSSDFRTSMYNTMKFLEGENLITDAGKTAEELHKREKLSGVGIPGTTFTLHHARSPAVNEPLFLILERRNAEPAAAMDGSVIQARRICIMLAPENMNEQEAVMLSHISGMMVKDEKSKKLFAEGTEEQIKQFMSEEFLSLYRS